MKRVKNTNTIIRKISGILGLFVIWEVTSKILEKRLEFGSTILPSIENVVKSIVGFSSFWGGGFMGSPEMNTTNIRNAILVILKQSAITSLRVFIGCAVGILIGIFFGILVSWNLRINRIVLMPIEIIRQIPLLILIPLFLLWFGGAEYGIYIYIIFCIFVVIFVNTTNAINNVPIAQKQFARTLGANKTQLYRTIIIPAIFPEISGGIRVCLGFSWAAALGAEYIGAQGGLGRMLILSESFTYTDRMIFIVILFIVYSLILNAIFKKFFDRITRWMPKEERY